jgi:hypothetical protein
MKSLSVAAKILAKTVIVNAFLWGVWNALTGDMLKAFGALLFLLVGFIVMLPLLMFIAPLVNVSTRLPYSIPAKTAWLTFYLIIMVIVFYGLVSMVISNTFFSSKSWTGQLIGPSIGGLLIAVLTTRKSLNELYAGS